MLEPVFAPTIYQGDAVKNYLKFFFGTPMRLFLWIIVVAVIVVLNNPSALAEGLSGLIRELSPLMGPLITVGLVFLAITYIFRGGKK